MVIIVPQFYHTDVIAKPFIVKEGLYKSLDGRFELRVDDTTGNEINPYITQEGMKFRLWKYKDWHGDWVVYETFHRT